MLETVHVSPFRGQWYPDGAGELRELIDARFRVSARRVPPPLPRAPLACIVPHAGIVYSGAVAAAGYRQVREAAPKRVIILGFSHHGGARGIFLPGDVAAYATPFGEIAVDRDAVRSLASAPGFSPAAESDLCDHSVEIQLPFVQYAAPKAAVVPVYVNRPAAEDREAAAGALAETMEPRDMLLASSDFTHYGRAFGYLPFPVDEETPHRLSELDGGATEAAGSLDPGYFLAALERTGATVCGRDPIALLLGVLGKLEKGDEIFQERLDYQTSGEITGDYSHSVSYAALAYAHHSSQLLDAGDQELLLESARDTLRNYQATGERRPIWPRADSPGLRARRSVFVSIHTAGGALRGCVGRCGDEEPLRNSVPAMTLAAAHDDTRFAPVTAAETGLHLEISVLSPFRRVVAREDIAAGCHGALLKCGYYRGLLLPQVASERDWDTPRFLAALADKAGAPRDVYERPEAALYRFRAQRFGSSI